MLTPASRFKSSIDRCGSVPTPADPALIEPDFASAISSPSVFAFSFRMHDQHLRRAPDFRERHEILLHIVTDGAHARRDEQRPRRAEQQHVAVAWTVEHRLGARGAAAAGDGFRSRPTGRAACAAAPRTAAPPRRSARRRRTARRSGPDARDSCRPAHSRQPIIAASHSRAHRLAFIVVVSIVMRSRPLPST